MTNLPAREQIIEAIRRAVSEALLIPQDQVIPSARLVSDLKAESIDVADIRFRIEDGLKIRIDQREMMVALGENLTAEELNNSFTVQFVIDYVTEKLTQGARG